MRFLHLFQWKLKDIISMVPQIYEAKFDAIIINVVQPTKNDLQDEEYAWYKNYQVLDLSIGNGKGSLEDIKSLKHECDRYGIKLIFDVVITHFANVSRYGSLEIHKNVEFHLRNNPFIWREPKKIDYKNRYSITHHCNGLPSIKIENYDYQDQVFEFLNELIRLGADGFRIDSCKMIALPHEFGENNNFFKRLNSNLDKQVLLIGELIHEDINLIRQYNNYNIMNLTEINKDQWNYNQDMYLSFVESHDSYLDDEIGFSKDWSSDLVVKKYKNECLNHKNSMFYARTEDDSWKKANIK